MYHNANLLYKATMFNNLRRRITSLAATVLVGLAATFNRNVTLPSVVYSDDLLVRPALPTRRKPAFRNGIKGIKGAHQGRYGATLAYRLQQSRNVAKASA